MSIDIRPARWPQDLACVRELLREYAQSLDVDLAFQDFENELASLPGQYAPPRGELLIAWRGSQALGCIALRPLAAGDAEMKRLYVRPQARGEHLGRRLAERACVQARAAGYARLCLDTLPSMAPAQRLYRSLGFAPIAPYVFNPVPGTQFLVLDLQERGPAPAVEAGAERD
ncbi:GNAT family N-acetyltransferase [Lysobacter firmicutimachus]|uniref:GNAT family N-acetyltransferase n=1 Tax=Lysobacter firmicutimachus TaxID=1792846 RepID=A0AAU8MRE6_9GAMM